MRTTTALATTALLLLGATACSSTPEAKPAPTVTTTVTAAPALTKTEITRRCVAELVAGKAAPEAEPATEAPPECEGLTTDEFLDAELAATVQHNEAGREKLQRQIDEATAAGNGQ
jgi:hypothetical protein